MSCKLSIVEMRILRWMNKNTRKDTLSRASARTKLSDTQLFLCPSSSSLPRVPTPAHLPTPTSTQKYKMK